MFRAVAVAVVSGTLVVGTFAVSGCSGGGNGSSSGGAPACPILAELAKTGETVANADVSDPTAFDKTFRASMAKYLETARRLREAVPDNLRPNVTLMIAAAEQHKFDQAVAARAKIDAFARENCKEVK